jgi:SpoVK/Ycf46/Vps4 family AAA+-type ATPase
MKSFLLGFQLKTNVNQFFKVHLSKFREDSWDAYDLNLLSESTNNFSGAEIRQSIVEGMHLAFIEGREFTTNDICLGIEQTIPLAQIDKEQIQEMQEWALSGRVRLASSI